MKDVTYRELIVHLLHLTGSELPLLGGGHEVEHGVDLLLLPMGLRSHLESVDGLESFGLLREEVHHGRLALRLAEVRVVVDGVLLLLLPDL